MKRRILSLIVCVAVHAVLHLIPSTLAAQRMYDFVVAADGSGDFKTVQEAIDAIPDFRKKQTTVFVRNGLYKEKLVLPTSKTNVKLIGDDPYKTILTFDDFAAKKNRFGEEIGTTGSSSFFIFGEDFYAENLTFENASGPVGQAVAVRVSGDRAMFVNCRFLGYQDTLYPHGERSRQYYKDCYIEGTTDFIFGSSTAVFENCIIFCKQGGHYITAASTPEFSSFGFIFINCKITGNAPANSFYLGRPWRPFAKTIFIDCHMDEHIRPEGWHNWNKPEAEKTTFYAEHGSRGPGKNEGARARWSHLLSDEEVKKYSILNIFGDWQPGQ